MQSACAQPDADAVVHEHHDARRAPIGEHVGVMRARVAENATEQKRSFREMSARSAQVANHLRALGVRRGDRILVMLGNEVALWETMLAAMKLGAVLIPATALLTPDDLRDRIDRGNVRHVVAASAYAPKFDGVTGDYTRICVGAPVSGWVSHDAADAHPSTFAPDALTKASDPLLLYFTSGTTNPNQHNVPK